MKKALFVLLAIAALAIASSAAVGGGGGGLDAWFMVDPGCVVKITPYADYGNGRLGARTFDRPAVIVTDKLTGEKKYEPARMQFTGDVYYDITLWCPGMVPTSQGTIYVPDWASGKADFWLPLHNQALGKCGPWAVYDGIK